MHFFKGVYRSSNFQFVSSQAWIEIDSYWIRICIANRVDNVSIETIDLIAVFIVHSLVNVIDRFDFLLDFLLARAVLTIAGICKWKKRETN